jgi:MFS transporter, CP family, cyanate transporter
VTAAVPDAPARPAVSSTLLLVAICLVALNLRVVVASLPPLLEGVRADLGLSRAAAGLLNALPVVAMGLFAPPAQWLSQRVGRETTVGYAVAAIGVGTLLRLFGGHPFPLYTATFIAGVGIAVAGTLLPALVMEFFAERTGAVTGMYTFALMGGAAASSAFSVPLAAALGSWERSLASWGIVAVAALAVWLPVMSAVQGRRATAKPMLTRHRLPWRSGAAWLVAAYLAANGVVFYSVLTWLAPMFEAEHHWSADKAGLLLAVMSLVQAPTGLLVPKLGDRMHDRRPLYYLMVGCMLVGVLGLIFVPTAFPWITTLVLGAGIGGSFALGLVLLIDRVETPGESASLAAMAFLVSYVCGAVGPVVVGALRDASGGFRLPLVLLAVVSASQLLLVTQFRPRAAGVR